MFVGCRVYVKISSLNFMHTVDSNYPPFSPLAGSKSICRPSSSSIYSIHEERQAHRTSILGEFAYVILMSSLDSAHTRSAYKIRAFSDKPIEDRFPGSDRGNECKYSIGKRAIPALFNSLVVDFQHMNSNEQRTTSSNPINYEGIDIQKKQIWNARRIRQTQHQQS